MTGRRNKILQALFGRGETVIAGRLHYAGHATDDVQVRGRLAFAGLSLVIVCGIGTAGYYAIGGGTWSLEDCLYMVLITITSVGYGEVLPVAETEGARTFTMALLVGGMGVSFYFLSALTAFIIEGDLREALWRRRVTRRLFAMKDHYIVCGAGRTGRYVIDELIRAGRQVVIIERDARRFDAIRKEYGEDFIALEGDATDDGVLREAGVDRAAGLVTALQLDQDNLFVSLSARQLNPGLRIVSRANADRVTPKLKQAGADAIVSPTHIGGRRMAHELLRPNVVGFLDFMVRDKQRNLDIEEVPIPPESPVVGRTLAKSRIREKSSALVLAVLFDGDATYNPRPDFELNEGMTMLCMGEREQLDRLVRYVKGEE